MLWLKRHLPEIFSRTHMFLNSTSYLNFRLTGVYAVDHYSAGNSSPYYLPDKLAWSDELGARHHPHGAACRSCAGQPTSIGHVTAGAAAETGLQRERR